jgi:hypothetical protein
MGIARGVFAVSLVIAAGLEAVPAQAQAQQEAPSPYSLGMSVGRAPIGLNASVVGRAQFSAFSAFGKVGTTTWQRSDTALMGMSGAALNESGNGLSWGGGVSWDFTPRMTASVEWVSYDLRMPTGPVRATNLGLQFKY